jgi:thiol:disulfide interchange protein DsbC
MKKFKIISGLLVALAATVLVAGCNASTSGGKSPDQIKTQLTKEIPGITKIDQVNKSPINGVYEVVVGRKVFYTTTDGKYLFFGNIIDPVSKKSLTEERTNELSKVDWKQLPLDLAIKEVNGTGERKIAVFSDPDCPYCQMFEKQVAPNLTNTTIYTFLFPLPMHPKAKPDSIAIWCSKDRAATWTAWMRNKTPLPTGGSCDTADLDKIYKIGTDVVQVEGTPTIILSNGQILPGMLPPDQLSAQMDQAAGIAPKDASAAK